MKFLHLIICLAFLFSTTARAEDHYFLRIQMAADDDSVVLWGKTTDSGILLMTSRNDSKEILFMDRKLVKEKRVELNKKFEKILEEKLRKDKKVLREKKEPPTTAAIVPLLQFQFTGDEVKGCVASKEFNGFLEQLPIFQEMIKEFALSLDAGKASKDCAAKVTGILNSRNIKVVPSKERFSGRGVLLRAQLYFNGIPEDVGPEVIASSEELFALPDRSEMIMKYADGTEDLIGIREHGYFFKSWTAKEFAKLAPMYLDFRSPKGEFISEAITKLPKIQVGEYSTKFDNFDSVQVVTSPVDTIEKVLVPKIVQNNISKNADATQNFSIGGHLAMFEFVSNAFEKNAGVMIPGGTAEININKAFSLHGLAYLPLSLGNNKIALTYLDTRFGYHPFRESVSDLKDLRFDVGAYFYNANATKVTNATGEQFVAQSVGMHFGAFYSRKFADNHNFEAGYLLGPASSTNGSTVTIAGRMRLTYTYTFDPKSAMYALYQSDRYSIRSDVLNTDFYLSFTALGLGYRYSF